MMKRWIRRILCGLSLLAAVVTVGLWVYVVFHHGPRPRMVWQGEREYSLTLEGYMYRVEVLHCVQEEGEVRGDLMRIRAWTAMRVPMRGVEHFSRDWQGYGFHFERVNGWPAVNPTRPLPPPVPLAGGGVLRTELRVHGVSVGVPFWFVIAAGVLAPALWVFGKRGVLHLRGRKARRRARQGLCVGCGYDLRGTPERCPECGLAAKTTVPAAGRAA
jgi:hypothetical protein